MIVTEGPTLEENLKRVTPWWDLTTKYLVAAMMAIALTYIVVQVTKDNVVCVPAVNCNKSTVSSGSLTVNVSDDSAKLCQSLTPKSSKKKILVKMVDRRLYDYVDSVCFQEMSCFTKFFPLFLLVEAVLLLVFDILWTKLPFSSSVLNHLVALTDECYSSLATIKAILRNSIKSEAVTLKVLNLVEKTEHFRRKYETLKKCWSRYRFYITRTIFQIGFCIGSFIINLLFEVFGKIYQFQCSIDEFVFAKEYDHFECSHPLAPYFHIAVILFIIFMFCHFIISLWALRKVWCHGNSYTFPGESNERRTSSNNDFAFFFYLLTQHDKLYADRVSYFFKTEEKLSEKVNNALQNMGSP